MKAEDLGFTFRDVARYLVPGSAGAALLLWFLDAFAEVPVGTPNLNLGGTLLFIFGSYVLGHLLDVIGDVTFARNVDSAGWGKVADVREGRFHATDVPARRRRNARGRSPSQSEMLSPEFRDALAQRVQEVFHVDLASPDAFDLCDTFISGKPEAQEQERLCSLAGLYHGLVTVMGIGMILSGLTVLKHMILFDYVNIHLWIAAFLVIATSSLLWATRKEAKWLCVQYVLATYRAFYTICAQGGTKKP